MKIKKSYEITDAKISFVSLVDKAANKKQFLITKAEKGVADFSTYGRILKVDDEHHYITGVVYEPLVKDSHDNFMTEDEIIKTAYWFAKNGDKVDLQHSFEELDEAVVVESWVTKSDETIEGEEIKKGTWLMTVEISDSDIWDKIQKKEITGFSMGGVGKYSDVDVDLDDIEENIEKGDLKGMNTDTEKKGIFKKLAETFGFDVIEKGAMSEEYNRKQRSSSFWNAMGTLEDLLCRGHWDYYTDRYVYDYENDETAIKEALTEFSEIVTQILTEESITKALSMADSSSIKKAGKKMSGTNKAKLDEIVQSLNDFTTQFADNEEEEITKKSEIKKEEDEVKPDEIRTIIQDEIKKAMNPEPKNEEEVTKTAEKKEEMVTKADIQEIIAAEIKKAFAEDDDDDEVIEKEDDKLTKDTIAEIIRKELSTVLKAKGVVTNLNDESNSIEKSGTHYLHGFL